MWVDTALLGEWACFGSQCPEAGIILRRGCRRSQSSGDANIWLALLESQFSRLCLSYQLCLIMLLPTNSASEATSQPKIAEGEKVADNLITHMAREPREKALPKGLILALITYTDSVARCWYFHRSCVRTVAVVVIW